VLTSRKLTTGPEPGGCGPGLQRTPADRCWWATPTSEHRAEQEAIGKGCGVPMARLPGFSRAPPSSIGKRGTWEAIVGSSAPSGSPSHPDVTNLKAVQDRLHEPPVSLRLHAD
jgi:hypothetical protein